MSSLVLSEIFPPTIGGSGHWLHELYSRQPPDRTVLLVGDHENAKEFDSESSLRIVRADLTGREWTLMTRYGRSYIRGMYKKIFQLKRQYGIKEIHCARVIPEGVAGWFASYALQLHLVCFVHGEDVELARESRETRWLVNRVLRRSSRLVCNSDNTKRILIEDWNCDETKIVVLNPGIDTTQFVPSDNPISLKKSLGWGVRPVLLTVSRLEIRKGHDMMIKALPELIIEIPDLLYVIVGTGSELTSLERLVAKLELQNHVEFCGGCDSSMLLSCLQACDVFILPNRKVGSSIEGFGIVLLEAQACAKPVIAGDSGGTSETMLPCETGLIVDCSRSENLVQPVLHLMQKHEDRLLMGLAARRLMKQKFDWTVIAENVAQAVFAEGR